MKAKKTKAFGVETTFEEADLILIPVLWEATASYGGGASRGPDLVRKASSQLDFFNLAIEKTYNHRIHFEGTDALIVSLNKKAEIWAKGIQKNWKEDKILNAKEKALSEKVNQASQSVLDWIYEKSSRIFQKEKIPALVGGEHSVSEGLIRLVGEKLKGRYGVLHLDAHADLRDSYQGFKYSHASVMYNVLNLDYAPQKLVQVGVRDLCEEEYQKIKNDSRVDCYFDEDISSHLFSGEHWAKICRQVVGQLPSAIYVSLDVDVLSWTYVPGTGAPVPGGLSFNQILYLLSEIRRQKKQIIAFDVVETADGGQHKTFPDWNGNVSARLIYHLAGLVLY